MKTSTKKQPAKRKAANKPPLTLAALPMPNYRPLIQTTPPHAIETHDKVRGRDKMTTRPGAPHRS